jgi:hypothetical protein
MQRTVIIVLVNNRHKSREEIAKLDIKVFKAAQNSEKIG